MATVHVNGTELFYRERGSGPPILLIHGLGGNADVWGDAFAPLSEQRVVAYDRRGFSRSLHAPVSDPQPHRADTGALLRTLDAAPATVVGWSSGGVVALDLAIHHPELVCALVLEEPPLHLKRRPGPRMLRALLATRLLNRVKDDRAASEAFFRWAFRYTSGGTGYDRIPDAVRETLLSNGNPNMAELAWATGEHLTKAQVAGIGCPVVWPRRRAQRAFPRAGHALHRRPRPPRSDEPERRCRARDAPRAPRGVRALSQGIWDLPPTPENEGAPASPNTGRLVRVGKDGGFTSLVEGLDRPTSLEFIGDTALVVTLTGKVIRIDNAGEPRGIHPTPTERHEMTSLDRLTIRLASDRDREAVDRLTVTASAAGDRIRRREGEDDG